MLEKNPFLALFLALSAGLCVGFGIGYASKPVPDPVIEWNGRNLTINGKRVDLDSFKFPIPLAPDKGKKKLGDLPGDLGPAAMISCPCVECSCPQCNCCSVACIDESAVTGQRKGNSQPPVEAFGIETLTKVLMELKEAIFGSKDKGTPGLKDDIATGLKDFWSSIRTGFIVAVGTSVGLLAWIALSLQRIADKPS